MLALYTLGELRLEGGSTAGLSSRRKELTLLTYLARRSPKTVAREELADLLWGDRDPARARQSLRQALLELKRMVGDGLDTGASRVGLAAGALTLDAACFESDLASKHWREAVARWRGEFLVGSDDIGGDDFRAWLEAERESLRRGLRLALLRLIEEARRNGAWNQGAAWATFWVEMLPLEEEGHRHLIELMHLDGRPVEALARYAEFCSRLRALDLEPTASFAQVGRVLEREVARAPEHRTPGSAALFTPDLVGRGSALAELLAAWEGVRAGRAATVLVEGEAGIGKSRLCEEFLRQLSTGRSPPVVVRARGDEPLAITHLALVSEIVGTLASAPGLGGASPRALAELSAVAPVLRDRFPRLPEANGSQPPLEEALAESLRVVSEEQPVILYIDDLPRCDRLSQALLRSVIARLSSPVLFLMTTRTGDHEPTSTYIDLVSDSRVRRLKLQLLGLREVETMLGSMLELPDPERQRLAGRLHAQGGGNPFYTIELTAAMVDEELLTPTESGSWRLAAPSGEGLIPMPATIREVVSRRLGRLDTEVRAVLEAAAVLGRTFDSELVPVVSGLAGPTCAVALEELIARRIIRGVSESPRVYEFTHEIICRVAYDLLSSERRGALHRSAAKAWQSRAHRSDAAKAAKDYHRGRGLRRTGASRWRRRALAASVVIVVAAAVAVITMPASRRASLVTLLSRGTPTLLPQRIVVAPLTNHTGDTTLAGLGALAADWIAQKLMRTTRFEVVDPRTASVASRIVERIPSLLRDRNEAIAIAHETGSGTVVSGDVFREGDSLRVLMQVIDAGSRKIVRALEPVSGVISAPSRLVSSLAEQVLAAVASAVDTTSRGFSAALDVPPSYEAYTEVSKAWESFFRDDLDDVFRRLDRATHLDTTYMTPLLMRAYVETRLANWPVVDTLVRRLAAHASTLTPAEAAVLAGLQADLRGDLWSRLRAARELMNLTPASVEGYTLAASRALYVNRPREAVTILSRVDPDRGLLLVAPFYWVTHTSALHRLGDHEAELESARQGVRRFPDHFWPHVNLLLALAATGDVRAVRRDLSRSSRDDPYPGTGQRHASLWVWRELQAHGHDTAATHWLATLVDQTPTIGPDTTLADWVMEGDVQYAARRWDVARQYFAAGLVQDPESPLVLGRLGATAARLGDRGEAKRLSAVLAGLSDPHLFGSQTYARARITAVLGDRAGAVELLRAAWAQGRPLAFDDRDNEDVHSDPDFNTLRDFPPFQALMRTD